MRENLKNEKELFNLSKFLYRIILNLFWHYRYFLSYMTDDK